MITRWYRKKPLVIEAIQLPFLDADSRAFDSADIIFKRKRGEDGRPIIFEAIISTLEGVMTAKAGDWIIRGVKGELYPCKPDIFAATYEEAA